MIDDITHPAIDIYEKTIAGIPDVFDCFTAQSVADDRLNYRRVGYRSARDFIRHYFDLLDTWYNAIDRLDADLRAEVEGALPEDHAFYLQSQALGLFVATTTLQRAIVQHHYGTAGPALSAEYGHAYPLSNSVVHPFGWGTAATASTVQESEAVHVDCLTVTVDGQTARIHGAGTLGPVGEAALAELIRTARRQHVTQSSATPADLREASPL